MIIAISNLLNQMQLERNNIISGKDTEPQFCKVRTWPLVLNQGIQGSKIKSGVFSSNFKYT